MGWPTQMRLFNRTLAYGRLGPTIESMDMAKVWEEASTQPTDSVLSKEDFRGVLLTHHTPQHVSAADELVITMVMHKVVMHMCLWRNQLEAETRDSSLQMRTRPAITLYDIEAIIRDVKITEDKLRTSQRRC